MNRLEALRAIEFEANSADANYGEFTSMHEAYGVLAEEVFELFEAVRMRQHALPNPHGGERRCDKIRAEAIQIAAVALRIAEQANTVLR